MKKNYAYSLVELLITLALLAILLLVAIPAWTSFLLRNDATTGADRIVSALQFVRLESIKRGTNVSFCRVGDPQEAAGDWSQGQIARDVNGKLIRAFDAVPKQDKLFWNSSLGEDDCITFTSTGVTDGQHGDFAYCPQGKSDNALLVVIQAVGEIHVATSMSNGDPISCAAS